MSRWWRAEDGSIDHPKLLRLSDAMHRAWYTLMCISSANGGALPPTADIALRLRVKPAKIAEWITALVGAELFDRGADGVFRPHNWNKRQYKTDVTDPTNAERQQRYRDRQRNAVTTVTDKRPETEQITETEQISEANASGAVAPIDPRKRLFDEGLPKLASLTGKGPDACRSFVGKCLKAAGDDAVTVLGLIEEAERNHVVDPSAWIAARLKPTTFPQGNSNAKRTVHDAARDLSERLRALDEPAPGLRDGSGESPVRLLSSR